MSVFERPNYNVVEPDPDNERDRKTDPNMTPINETSGVPSV